MSDWRTATLPGGAVAEYVDAALVDMTDDGCVIDVTVYTAEGLTLVRVVVPSAGLGDTQHDH
jgi:hypothetical protein